MIKIQNLSKIYDAGGQKVIALDNINLTIKDGSIFGIIGLSGAGKSSLVRCINRLEEPTSGRIYIDDIDITSLDKKSLREARKKIGMIFQHFNLLSNATVFENVAFPLMIAGYPKKKIKERVYELLRLVDLEEKSQAYPSQLSGGQKQRVGIARALANHPRILLSDEATSALDPKTTKSILHLLKDINRKFGITIVIITHEMDVIKEICDEVAVIENGKIIEQASVVDLFTNPSADTTRTFIEDITESLPESIKISSKPDEKFVKISFRGSITSEPVISRMIKKFDVDVNIIKGSVDNVRDISIGKLLISITGNPDNILHSIEYLKETGLKVEVLTNELVDR
ncbi:D-methionine transport system ATP-binding protein [Caldanaerobius fijiensis DSM 17918]|uniref:D-methionine transport system ATP-binding protein n=1 Tax=Caldanaerobius fijiensis DSM 17918 TaxID=1121256 RepID=A0A1M5A866_9THEO|nr:methionine ABC transporter ATP-binding protein [Caldanaerobius fijiensis]SHF26490.1 D-methionine transport system ATP-binding protein [Caldanaerobius fijiensis DSM 17918]